jgi:hypothetical protein
MPSSVVRLAVGIFTQNVDNVVTIWLMPSMMAFARLLIASSAIPDATLLAPCEPQHTTFQTSHSFSAISDAGPGNERAQITELAYRATASGRDIQLPVAVLPEK